jgi:hypothetical protein
MRILFFLQSLGQGGASGMSPIRFMVWPGEGMRALAHGVLATLLAWARLEVLGMHVVEASVSSLWSVLKIGRSKRCWDAGS